MRIHVIALFPELAAAVCEYSMVAKAIKTGALEVVIHDLREYGLGRHRVVDDYPFGGGPGMVLKPEPLAACIRAALAACEEENPPVVFLSPQGRRLDQARAYELARTPELFLLCGHYKGIDERIREMFVTDELSVGDYVLSGGEPAAVAVIDAVARLLPGVLNSEDSHLTDSFARGGLDHAHYTRPEVFEGRAVPEELLSGHHARIDEWRTGSARRRTAERRPELLDSDSGADSD